MTRQPALLRCAAALLAVPLVLAAPCAAAVATAQQEFREAVGRVPNLAHGRELFATCAACHSSDGSGIDDGSVPSIAGQHFPVIVKQLTDFRNDRRWDVRMEHFVDRHHLAGPEDIADVAGYVNSLPLRPTPKIGDGSALRLGASVYFRSCEGCHGAVGEGDAARLRPRLAGQHYGYLVRQIHDSGDGRRPNMTMDHVRLVRRLSLEELSGVADYLSRLNPHPGQGPGPGASLGPPPPPPAPQ
jgi:cytochrome c553